MRNILGIALISFSSVASSAPDSVPLEIITPLMMGYLKATTCSGDSVDPRLVVSFSDAASKVKRAYLAATHSDLICLGGSGTWGPTLVVLRTAAGQEESDNALAYLKVEPMMSEPVAQVVGAPKALTELRQVGGQLMASGLEYGPFDANCCPSVKRSYTLKLVRESIGTDVSPRYAYTWIFTPIKK